MCSSIDQSPTRSLLFSSFLISDQEGGGSHGPLVPHLATPVDSAHTFELVLDMHGPILDSELMGYRMRIHSKKKKVRF